MKLSLPALLFVGLALAQDLPVNGNLTVYGTLKSEGAASKTDHSAALSTRPMKEVTSAPTGACVAGDGLQVSRSTKLIYGCDSGTNTWAVFGGSAAGVTSLGGLTGALTMSTPLPDNALNYPNWGSGANALRIYFPLASAAPSATGALISGAEYTALAAKAQTGAACPAGQHISQISSSAAPTCTADSGSSLPSQSGNSGKYLTTDGTNASWGTVSGGASIPCAATIAANQLQVAAPCAWKYGEASVAAGAAIITATGSGAIYLHGNSTGLVVYGSGSAAPSCLSGCTASGVVVTGYQPGLVPLWSATVTAGTLSAAVDGRQPLGAQAVASIDPNIAATNGADGSRELALASTISLVSRVTAPVQTGTNAARPTTCITGQLYYQTDGTAGLYRHDGGAGSCSWTVVGSGGGGLTTRQSEFYAGSYTTGGALVLGPGIVFGGSTGVSLSVLGGSPPSVAPVISFTDGTTSSAMDFDVTVPSGWTSGATLTAVGILSGGSATVGQVARYSIQTVCLGPGESALAPTFNAAQTLDFVQAVVNNSDPYQNTATLSLTTTGCAAGETMRIRVIGNRTDAGDTVAATHHWRRWMVTL